MGKSLLFALIFMLFVNFSYANEEELVTSEQAVAFSNRLMIEISRGKIQQAWRKVKANSVIPPERVDAFAADYQNHYNQTIQYFGQPLGVELVAQEAHGRSLLRVTYLLKYDVTGVAWYLYFYRLNNQWAISEFNFDLNSNSLFTELNRGGGDSSDTAAIVAWQEKYESRLAALEENLGNKPSFQIDPSSLPAVGSDPSASILLVEMQAKIYQMEAQLANYKEMSERLQTVENRMGAVNDKVDAIAYQLDPGEIANIRKMIKALRQQHPFMDAP